MDLSRDILGESAVHQHALREARLIATTSASVLICGESGTGKELFARMIHRASQRKGPLVIVNCATLPEALADSLLFGHRRGAFTGATESSAGLFVSADEGTLFLDEIAELPLPVQAKLLRVLQEGAVMSVGDTRERPVHVRIIAASHRDLRARVREGLFREDLYFRLARFALTLPPLRERGRDVLLIARHYLAHSDDLPRHPRLTRTAESELMRHPWPGNIRELQNLLFQVALRASDTITAADLRRALGPACADDPEEGPASVLDRVSAAGDIGAADLERATRIPRSSLKRILRSLVEAGSLVTVGQGKATRYRRSL